MKPVHYIIYRICVNIIGLGLASVVIDKITLESFISLVVSSIILTFFQSVLRPMLVFLTLPFQLLSLGFGYMLVNSFLLKATAGFLQGLTVSGFWASFFGALIISFVGLVFDIMSANRTNSNVQIYYRKDDRDDL